MLEPKAELIRPRVQRNVARGRRLAQDGARHDRGLMRGARPILRSHAGRDALAMPTRDIPAREDAGNAGPAAGIGSDAAVGGEAQLVGHEARDRDGADGDEDLIALEGDPVVESERCHAAPSQAYAADARVGTHVGAGDPPALGQQSTDRASERTPERCPGGLDQNRCDVAESGGRDLGADQPRADDREAGASGESLPQPVASSSVRRWCTPREVDQRVPAGSRARAITIKS